MESTTPGAGPISPVDPRVSGPLDRATALALLTTADQLVAAGEFQQAGANYQRVIGFDDPAVTAAALLGSGNVLYRLDREAEALATWRAVLQLGETPSAYPAWRQIAAALVRDGDLHGATNAYREAERRAPAADRPEIASRLGWLSKETGDAGAARRYFAKSRGATGLPIPLTYLIIGLTVIVSLAAMTPDGAFLFDRLELDKGAVAAGEWWRLLTVTLVHAPLSENPLHLAFNMYALYLVGPIAERMYGWKVYGLIYVLCAAAGSVGSYLLGPATIPSVGASGAIFGLFGLVLAATRIHRPVLDRQGRALVGQIGMLIVINLLLGLGIAGAGGGIDNAAHVGGLLAGLWLGFVLVPGNVQTMRGLWQMPGHAQAADRAPGSLAGAAGVGGAGVAGRDQLAASLIRVLAVAALVVVLVAGIAVGSDPSRFSGPAEISQVLVRLL